MLVVGASATGVQIADEIQRSGRPVTVAVGEHVRGPRVYRGRDIHWWMDVAGRARRALRRGGRHRARAPRAVDAARRLARARHVRPQRAHRHRREAGRPSRRDPRRAGPSSPARCGTSATSPTSSSAGCSTRSTSGRRRTASTTRSSRRIGSSRPRRARAADARPRSRPAARSRRSSGRPASGPTTPGST